MASTNEGTTGPRRATTEEGPVVHSVTTARTSVAQDRAERQRRYLVSMVIRTLCFAVAIFTPHPWWMIPALGAVFLPYVAVVLANAVNVHPEGEIDAVHGTALGGAGEPLRLGGADDDDPGEGPVTPHPAARTAGEEVHVGEVISSRTHEPPGRA